MLIAANAGSVKCLVMNGNLNKDRHAVRWSMSQNQHIIEYILECTDERKVRRSMKNLRKFAAYDHRKIKIDDMLYYCESCELVWSSLPKSTDGRGSEYYRGGIPTIGKKRKTCKTCKRKEER